MDELENLVTDDFPEEELMESEEAFLVIAQLVHRARTVDQIVSTTALDGAHVEDVLAMGADVGILSQGKASPPRWSINWKRFSRFLVEGAMSLDTEISIMVETHEGAEDASFEEFAARANRKVTGFMRDLWSNPQFTALLKDYLKLLVEEFLADDPAMYDMTLLDVVVAFENLLVKLGPGSLKSRSSKSAALLSSMRAWSHYASEVNMLGEVALAEVMQKHGLLRS